MKICYDCANSINSDLAICPFCGANTETNHEPKEAYQMKPGSTLKNGRYLIGRALGYGGFGVTYAGYDTVLEKRVAIKEYLPSDYSTRTPGTVSLSVFGGEENEVQYMKGLRSFTSEAEKLAKFNKIEGIVTTYDCFNENNTAYIVMELLDGETLKSYLKGKGKLSYDETLSIILPVLDTLREVHKEGIIHRDISPDNIFMTTDGKIKLLDFGAARYATANAGKSLSVILKPGYAPEEQYRSRGNQGSWSDVYAVGATMYKMLTGVVPDEALERAAKDTLKPPSKLGVKLPKRGETAILNALNVNAASRIQTAEEFSQQLIGTTEVKRMEDVKAKKPGTLPAWLYAVLGGVLLLGLGFAALVFTGVIGIGGKGASIDRDSNSGFEPVPNVVGMTEEEAKTKYSGWRFRTDRSDATDEVPVGCIMEQTPGFAALVAPRTEIFLTVNRGIEVEEGTMPYLRAVTLDEAREQLGDDYVIKEVYEYDDSVVKGIIKGTEPDYGEPIAEGQEVTLVISRGGLLEAVEINWNEDTISLKNGQEPLELTAVCDPANIEEGAVTLSWSVADTSVASYADGKLAPVGVGNTEITVTASMVNEETGETVTFSASKPVEVSEVVAAATEVPETPIPTATPTPAVTNSPTPTKTPKNTGTPTPNPSKTPRTSNSPTPRPSQGRPTPSPTPRTTSTPTPRPSQGRPTPSPTPRTTSTPTPSPRTTPTPTPSPRTTPTPTPSPRITPTPTPSPRPTSTPVQYATFTDSTFEKAFRKAYGYSGSQSIPMSDILGMTSLKLPGKGISNITDVAMFSNLTELNLSGNRFSNISPIRNLRHLVTLNISNVGGLDSLSPLTGLTNLKTLYLAKDSISDVSPLGGLTKLEKLYLSENNISNVRPLKTLTNLKVLDLRSNNISDEQKAELRAALPNCSISF